MMGILPMNLLASFAESERALIIDCTQSGGKRAIESGIKMGRKPKFRRLSASAMKKRAGLLWPRRMGLD